MLNIICSDKRVIHLLKNAHKTSLHSRPELLLIFIGRCFSIANSLYNSRLQWHLVQRLPYWKLFKKYPRRGTLRRTCFQNVYIIHLVLDIEITWNFIKHIKKKSQIIQFNKLIYSRYAWLEVTVVKLRIGFNWQKIWYKINIKNVLQACN